MLIGYARVSTDDQLLDLQRDALEKAGCERVFEDIGSGAKAERVGLTALLTTLRKGDTVVIWRLDRLGRSLKDLIRLVEQLDTAGVGLRSLQESIDTVSIGGRLVFHLFGALRELVKKNKHPVALFVDEAHDLNGHTLTGLKRLMEIGYRTDIFSLDGITGSQREYIHWLLDTCTEGKVAAESILTEEAIDLLATKLRTPLQIQLHLSLSLEAGYLTGEKPVSAEPVESVLSRQLDDLEPTLTRHGYRIKDLVEQFDAKPTETKELFSNMLDPARAAELRDKMLAAGLPI